MDTGPLNIAVCAGICFTITATVMAEPWTGEHEAARAPSLRRAEPVLPKDETHRESSRAPVRTSLSGIVSTATGFLVTSPTLIKTQGPDGQPRWLELRYPPTIEQP